MYSSYAKDTQDQLPTADLDLRQCWLSCQADDADMQNFNSWLEQRMALLRQDLAQYEISVAVYMCLEPFQCSGQTDLL